MEAESIERDKHASAAESSDPDFNVEAAAKAAESGDPEFDAEIVLDEETEEADEDEGLHITVKQEGVKDYYLQKYKQEWELLPEFRDWLQPVPDDHFKAECVVCCTTLRCHKLKLRQHALSRKHRSSMALGRSRRHTALSVPRAQRRSFGRRVVSASSGGRGRGRGRGRGSSAERQEPQDVSYSDTSRVTYSIGLGGNKVGFIGAGVLAQAVARAILDKGVIHSGRLTVAAPSSKHMSIWSGWGTAVTNSNDIVMQTCDLVFLAVPPAVAERVLRALSPAPDCGERCFISLVPGLSRSTIETILFPKFTVSSTSPDETHQSSPTLHVIRCMVNLAVRTGNGCCAYSLPAQLPDRWLLCLEVVCGSLGLSEALDDAQLDAFAAAFTGGTAFALAFSDALALGAASVGLAWPLARKMAAQTLLGTGQLMLDADFGCPLQDESAPAGNPAIAGLVALQQTNLKAGIASAVQACLKTMKGDNHH